jgi:AraC-like DNA-binding protein
MDSFFFNTVNNRSYNANQLYKKEEEYINRVDISNGLVFFDISLIKKSKNSLKIKNLDRMSIITVVLEGQVKITDLSCNNEYKLEKNSSTVFCSSRQNLQIDIANNTKAFVLFISDFFLKRYLLDNTKEIIDYVYNLLQGEISLEKISSINTDALSEYLIKVIIESSKDKSLMKSIKTEHKTLEFLIHRLSLIDLNIPSVANSEELEIANKAKNILLQNIQNTPTIKQLARKCATNEFKLKNYFKKVFQTTIYTYIQKIKMEKANLLLRDKCLNIGEISQKVGYKHQGNFSALFYKTYGIYPKDLLKK